MTLDDADALATGLATLRGSLLATECLVNALVQRLPPESRVVVHALHETEAAAFRAALESSAAEPATIEAFERHLSRSREILSDGFDKLASGTSSAA